MVAPLVSALIILAVAFAPSLWYMVRARNWERYGREPYVRLLLCFGYGAVVAVIISLVLSSLLMGELLRIDRVYDLGSEHFIGAVVVAPLVEELAKAAGLVLVLAYMLREEDGMVYGIAIGLGFAATENLLYELSALASAGVVAYLMTAILRTISSTLLHATATGTSGLGVGKAVVSDRSLLSAFPYYLVAVLMHAVFNFIASLGRYYPDTFGEWTAAVSLLLVIFFATFAWVTFRDRISAA